MELVGPYFLRRIGLTEGEIKIYKTLILLGESSIFKIMKKSGVSSSKVYLILDRLIQKGLVGFIIKNNVKKFQVTNPRSILDLVETKRLELDNFKKEFKEIIPEIKVAMSSAEEETAWVYKGIRGVMSAYYNLLDELKSGEVYYFFSVSKEELTNKDVKLFFKSYHPKRIAKKVKVKGIADIALKGLYRKEKIPGKFSSVRFYKLTIPVGLTIGKNRIIILMFGEESFAYELVSKRLAVRYRKLFNRIWKIAKK